MKEFFLLSAALLITIAVHAQTSRKPMAKGALFGHRTDVKDASDKFDNRDSATYLQIKAPPKPFGKAPKKVMPKLAASQVKH
ncbi:MAG: hypothetical protein JSU03_08275 [Bacteroidetes bacterium]|nr:hypothetical protein [Bacteroidota bacterium]MBS1757259.1 hypothetical protein [Bacteroidota bacterium]